MLLSGNVQSEDVGAGQMVQTTILLNISTLSISRPALLSRYVQSEHIAAEESVQKTILSEP